MEEITGTQSGRNKAKTEAAQGEPEEGSPSFFDMLHELVLSAAGLRAPVAHFCPLPR